MAGINCALSILGKEQIVLDRSQAYIGVLIDDLVTKDNREPYRMMTSRAEYRLLLRQDNADLRLRKIGYEAGLISEEDYKSLLIKEQMIAEEIKRLKETKVGGLRIEARQKLKAFQPVSVGQASRISGVSPADISVLLVYLEQYNSSAFSY